MDQRRLERLRHRLAATGDGAVGTLAQARGYITHAQFLECLKLQKTTHKGRPLGELLVERRYLTREQLTELILSR